MNRIWGFLYSILFSLVYFRQFFACRFAEVPNIRAANLSFAPDFFAGPGLYIRGNSHGKIHIGAKVLFGPQVMVLAGNHLSSYHQAHLFDYNDHDPNTKDIVVNNGAWIGARTILLSGAHVGEGTIVGCNSVVNKELKPYCIYAGSPAKLISPRYTKNELEEMLISVESKLSIKDVPYKTEI